jgi:phosphoribosylformylglycinamidine synthase subunit PurS
MDRIAGMARVVVDVMPKPEILDPQGKAVTGALARLGFAGVTVRQGKRFELDVDGELTEERLAEVHRAAETLLANTVIETFNVRVEGAESAGAVTPVKVPDAAADEPAKGSSGALDARVEEPGPAVGGPQVGAPGGAGRDAARGAAKAVDARVEEPGPAVGEPEAEAPDGTASKPARRRDKARDARVKEPNEDRAGGETTKRLDSAVEAPVDERDETVRDAQEQSSPGVASEPTGTDEAPDAGENEPEETVEDSHAQQQKGTALDTQAEPPDLDAQAEPPDPAASRAR